MPSFLTNKWFLVVAAVFAGAVLERKMMVLDKIGLGTFFTPGA